MKDYLVRYVHKISPRDTDKAWVKLPGGAFSDSKTLARHLRSTGILSPGTRLRSFRVEGDKVVAFPDRGVWHSLTLEEQVP